MTPYKRNPFVDPAIVAASRCLFGLHGALIPRADLLTPFSASWRGNFRFDTAEQPAQSAVGAAERTKGTSTKEEFVAAQKARDLQMSWRFDRVRIESQFDEIDADGDGIASGKEKTAYWSKVMREKKEK